eukprot:2275476-Rhodomonas_salina.1
MVPVESGEVLKEPSEDGERRRELEYWTCAGPGGPVRWVRQYQKRGRECIDQYWRGLRKCIGRYYRQPEHARLEVAPCFDEHLAAVRQRSQRQTWRSERGAELGGCDQRAFEKVVPSQQRVDLFKQTLHQTRQRPAAQSKRAGWQRSSPACTSRLGRWLKYLPRSRPPDT